MNQRIYQQRAKLKKAMQSALWRTAPIHREAVATRVMREHDAAELALLPRRCPMCTAVTKGTHCAACHHPLSSTDD